MINKGELFDAYDIDGHLLGYDLTRGQAIPEGVYHYIIEIYTFNVNCDLLVTKRHLNKFYPLYWEVTAGAVSKGETPKNAAIRELREETGLIINEQCLHQVGKEIDHHSIIVSFLTKIPERNPVIELEENETIDYQWIAYPDILEFIHRGDFVPTSSRRMTTYMKVINDLLTKV